MDDQRECGRESGSELEVDVDESALTQTCRAQRSASSQPTWFPDGPHDLNSCLGWADRYCQSLSDYDINHSTKLLQEFTETVGEQIVVTTSYSGIGSAENALASLVDAVQKHHHRRGLPLDQHPVVFYSVTEKMPAALKLLDSHGPQTKALHRFGDILHRVPEAVLQTCRVINDEKLAKGKSLDAAFTAGKISKEDLVQQKHAAGRELVEELSNVLEHCDFLERAWCLECKAFCPLSPRASPQCTSALWIEISGSTCCPFSSMGPCGQWLDAATLPCPKLLRTQCNNTPLRIGFLLDYPES